MQSMNIAGETANIIGRNLEIGRAADDQQSIRASHIVQGILKSAIAHERAFDFESAGRIYRDLMAANEHHRLIAAEIIQDHMARISGLMAEKALYERIDRNGRQILSTVGMNLADSPEIMEILLTADAVDFDNDGAVFVPLKPDYVKRCLDTVPRTFPGECGPNSFGTGATPPFLKREGDDTLRAASAEEFNEILQAASEYSDAVRIFSLPVQTDRSMSDYECVLGMDRTFPGLKMACTKKMADHEAAHLAARPDWLDGTSLMTSLTPMNSMVPSFIRSASNGSQLLLLDLTIAGASGPNSPEALLTLIHAQVLFMMVLAQTVNPGIVCVHGGIPGIMDTSHDLSYSSPLQPMINAALARLNRWVTGFPSAQSGGSTSLADDLDAAIQESEISRSRLRRYGVHMVRHALGAMGNLTFFSLEKFMEDCKREAWVRKNAADTEKSLPVPHLWLPEDPDAVGAVREMALRGNPRSTDHNLRHVNDMAAWERQILAAEEKETAGTDSEKRFTIAA